MKKSLYDFLMASEKTVKERQTIKPTGLHDGQTFTLLDEEGHQYRLFTRESKEFPENFSIGINIFLDGEEVLMCRFNGRHGPNLQQPHHEIFHSHNPEWKDGFRMRKSLNQINEESYGTFQDALTVVCKRCKIKGMEAYFPELEQMELGFEDE